MVERESERESPAYFSPLFSYSYIKMYGYQFTKQDHVKLVHLLLELILTPNLESPLLCTWADLLTMLLK